MLRYAAICSVLIQNQMRRFYMSIAVRISDRLAKKARVRSKALHRSLAGQIEYWAEMGEILEDNPDLTFSFHLLSNCMFLEPKF